jgi:hypothetical protein
VERDKEIKKLMNVLRRVARAASYVAWNRSAADATVFCVKQYNKILARLVELEPAITSLFPPLAENASAEVVHMSARELAAYFEDEAPSPRGRHRHARGCGSVKAFVGWSPFVGRGW